MFVALEVGSIPLIEKSNKFPVSNPASKYVFEYGRSGNDRISNVAQTLLDQNVSALAIEGQQYVRDHHTWNVRARELADLVAKTCT